MKPKTKTKEYTFNPPPFLAAVFGPRRGLVAVYPGDSEGEASGPAMRKWQDLQRRYEANLKAGKDVGTAPLHVLYATRIASPLRKPRKK